MKEDFNDIEFKQLFKDKAHKPGKNTWFTRRVLNRLPEKENSNIYSIEKWVYIISVVLCGICWVYLFKSDFFDVITVRTLIHTLLLVIGSILLVIQALRSIFSF